MECVICFEIIEDDAYTTKCGHIFCDCILQFIATSNKCPTCHQTLGPSDLWKIFLPSTPSRHSSDFSGMSDELDQVMLKSLSTDFQTEKKKMSHLQDLVERLSESFSKLDSSYDEIIKENRALKNDIQMLKEKLSAKN